MAFRGSDRQFLKKLASKLRVEGLEELFRDPLAGGSSDEGEGGT